MQISRRRFVSWLGASTVLGGASLAYGAGSPAEALSTILRDSKPKTDKEKPAHGAVEAHPKHAATEHGQFTTAEEIWSDLIEGNHRFISGKPKTRPLVAARQQLVSGQHPQVIVLGCADSRVSPELVSIKTGVNSLSSAPRVISPIRSPWAASNMPPNISIFRSGGSRP